MKLWLGPCTWVRMASQAALKLLMQSVWRGWQARLLVRHTRAAIMLQAAHRGAAVRRQV